MTYAKLIDGVIIFAPKKLVVGNSTVYNPTAEMLEADGWKEVVYTDPPTVEPGYVAVSDWTEEDDAIVQVWHIEEKPTTEEEALLRYANELSGAEDETLEEVTERLIKMVKEEN